MSNRSQINDIALTVDVDWAPDFMIDFVAEILLDHRVRATWFITHESPALARLRMHSDLFELGIHPNFFPGSTHGDSATEILSHCMELVPEAISLRTHGLFQSTALLAQIMQQTGIRTDVSLFLPHAEELHPVEYQWAGRTLLRLPYFWEDDFEMERTTPYWRLEPLLDNGSGLKIFDFHPVHVYLNSSTMEEYQRLKQRAPKLSGASPEDVPGISQTGAGTQKLFLELVKYLGAAGHSWRISDIHERWQERSVNLATG